MTSVGSTRRTDTRRPASLSSRFLARSNSLAEAHIARCHELRVDGVCRADHRSGFPRIDIDGCAIGLVMRCPTDHKAEGRAGLLRAGTRAIKVAGFNRIGVDGWLPRRTSPRERSTRTSPTRKRCWGRSSRPASVSRSFPTPSPAVRPSGSIVALMLGAVSISRATSDAAMQAKVLDAAWETAGRLISPGKQPE